MSYAIRSPQAPADIVPVPWEERPLSDLGAPANVVAAANAMGIRNCGDLATYPDWTCIPGVGGTTADKMRRVLEAYQS